MTIKKNDKTEKVAEDGTDASIENDKAENVADEVADASNDNKKTNKIAEKLKKMGVMASKKKPAEEEGRKVSPLLIMLLFAIPAAGVIVYMNMPAYIDKLIASASDFTFSSDTNDEQSPATVNTQAQIPVGPSSGRWNQSDMSTANQFQEPQWLVAQRAEMEKRRLEFQKQNPEPEWMAQQRAEMEKRRLEFQKQNPEPEWVTQQRAEMEKRQSEFQAQNADNSAANWGRSATPPEPPQWVKDRQAEMAKYQQAMEKQQKQWSGYPVGGAYNGIQQQPNYMNQPRMNGYQQNYNTANNQVQTRPNPVQQNQRQYSNGYYPPQPYYNNVPFNGYGPYGGAPYGWNGYRY